MRVLAATGGWRGGLNSVSQDSWRRATLTAGKGRHHAVKAGGRKAAGVDHQQIGRTGCRGCLQSGHIVGRHGPQTDVPVGSNAG